MPTPVTFSNLEQLIERIAIHMTANGAGENTGERTQQLLMEMVLGVLAIVGDAPDGTGSIQPWKAGLEYTDQVIVEHGGFLWLYSGGATNTGTEPGTDEDVWLSMGAPVVTAASLEEVLAVGHTTGANNIEVASGQRIDFRGPESDGTLSLKPISVTDDNTIYLPDRYGTIALLDDLDAQDLHAVLVNGSETNGRSITVSEFDGVNFEQGANMARVKAPASLTALRTLLLPDKDGTLATKEEVDAVAALVDGTLKAPEAFVPTGTYPVTYGGVGVQRGDTFRLGAGTMGAVAVNAEDLAVALVDAPGQVDANWQVIESNRTVVSQVGIENSATTDNSSLVSPQRFWQGWTKGLTLAGFFAAVRGVVLTGYTAGANTAIAATDSILGAFGKVQGQITATNTAVSGKLAKASNLSDLANTASARTNLGLGFLAGRDSTDILRYDTPAPFVGPGTVKIGSLLDWDFTGGWKLATDRVVAIALNTIGPNVTIAALMGNVQLLTFPPTVLSAGSTYYLDSTTPGGMTTTPGAIRVGVAISSTQLLFAPSSLGSSDTPVWIQWVGADSTNLTTGANGKLLFQPLLEGQVLAPGSYRVELNLRMTVTDTVNTPALPGNASIRLGGFGVTPSPPSPAAIATICQQVDTAGAAKSFAKRGFGWMALEPVADGVEFAVVVSGIYTDFNSFTIRPYIASSDADHSVAILDSSFIRIERINDVA